MMEFDASLVQEFVAESQEHLASIEEDFLALEQQADNPDKELIGKVFRAIHSTKGAAGCLGFTHIAELSHVMETLLDMMRDGEIKPEACYVDALLAGVDHLNRMLADIDNSGEVDTEEISETLRNLIQSGATDETRVAMATPVPLADSEGVDLGFVLSRFRLERIPDELRFLYLLSFDLNELMAGNGPTPVTLSRDLISVGQILDARLDSPAEDLRSPLDKHPLQIDLLLATGLAQDAVALVTGLAPTQILRVTRDEVLAHAMQQSEAAEATPAPAPAKTAVASKAEKAAAPAMEQAAKPKPKETPAPAKSAKKKTTTAPVAAAAAAAPAGGNGVKKEGDNGGDLIRIPVALLNQLMTLAGELVLVRNQQLLHVNRDDAVARGIAQRLDLVTTELQEMIMRTRMQPVGNIFGKVPRIIRDLSRKLNKKIELQITGNEVELDKTILESLTDPLTHLVRNCCDHAIEVPAERRAAGKPETGLVRLDAFHEGGQINILIRDDGKGLDTEVLKAKALERELFSEAELEAMSERELQNLITLPGFSTAKEVSDVSGRGVGMDVVRASLEKLGGTLEIQSELGQGTTMHLRLPLTLAIIPCLVVVVQGERYAIPQVNLEELVRLYDDDVRTTIECADGQEVYRLRDRLLPMVRLGEVLERAYTFDATVSANIAQKYRQQQTERTPGTHQALSFAVVKVGDRRFGLIVDEVLGTEEIVVKPMHGILKSLSIYSGATVLGDGRVALILDIEGVATHAGIDQQSSEDAQASELRHWQDVQTVLLFKSGGAEQYAVALPLVKRIERIPLSAIEQVANREFITIDDMSTLIMRLDQVLPVTSQIEGNEAYLLLPKHSPRPFGILVNQIVDIVETPLELNVDSYQEEGLLGTAIVRDHMTLFLDLFALIERFQPDWFGEHSGVKRDQKVLLVEDTSFFRQLVRSYLEGLGFDVETAQDGVEGLARLDQGRYDLVVSDLEMPRMDGWEFVRQLRGRDELAQLPVIALTALDSETDREQAFAAGFDGYEVKLDRERLLTCIQQHLAHPHQLGERA